MNIFCYPGITKEELSLMRGTEIGDLPQFGFRPRIRLTSGYVERTEIDMKLGPVLFEAKLTESDFQTLKAVIVEGYPDLKFVAREWICWVDSGKKAETKSHFQRYLYFKGAP